MNELLQELVDSRGAALRVDREKSVIRGVKLLGLQSRNGRTYRPEALSQAAALYEGAKVNLNHPKGHPLSARDYQDRLGHIAGVVLRDGEGLFGDLHFNPKHALAEQLLWDAEHAPQHLGLSHNVQARTSRQGDQVVVEAILKVQSVDLVADPATTQGLFEAASPTLTLDALRRERPDLVAQLQAAAAPELEALREELAQLRAGESLRERRRQALELLAEFKLPEPGGSDPQARTLVSESFFASLLAAPDVAALRRLVEERAALVASAGRWNGAHGPQRPVAREQTVRDAMPVDAASFARAIR